MKISYQGDLYPEFFYNSRIERYDGPFIDMTEEISDLLGVSLEVSNSEEGDIGIGLFTEDRKKSYLFTNPLINKELLLVGDASEKKLVNKDKNKVGIIKNYISEEILLRHLPEDAEIIEFSSLTAMVDALRSGRINTSIMDTHMFTCLQLLEEDIELYKIVVLDSLPFAISLKREDRILLGILNKVLENFIDYKVIKDSFLDEVAFSGTLGPLQKKSTRGHLPIIISVFGVYIVTFLAGFKFKTNKRLKNLAYYDHLTTALNRVSFKETMKKVDFKRDRGIGMYIDLNDFKVINDNYGHHAGDMILKEAVFRLQKVFSKDTVYRLAGDEFFIFHRNASIDEGVKLAERALAELNSPINILDTTFNIGASIGICELHEGIDNLDYFLHKADIAMFNAKKNGRGSIVVASRELVKEFEESKALERDFKMALQKNEIIPYFQPKVNLQTSKVIGLEALARWVHPQRGSISPATFIPLAEDIGLIYKLDMKMAEITIKTMKEWLDRGVIDKNFKASFNVSVQTFEEIDVYEQINYLLNKYDLSGEAIEIELTESVFIKRFSKVLGELNSIKDKLGTSVALDDFTAGYSSLRELGKLDIDSLKFDRSLLQSIKENSEKGQKIYRTLIRLCSDLEYTSIAEGIEEADEGEFLKNEGVTYAQGFYFGKPMPEESFLDLLNKNI